ncbi:HdeD family acid-resistance protein [Anaerolentibacter hominis]|uniref:HdeD family acid-resistance protein n=1 Tax=Anaerolentibacter hominis TaxID=3079009 RepID=UPI0031B80EC5
MEILKTFKKNYVVVAVLYMLFGLVLLIWPEMSLMTICYSFGVITIVFGIVRLIGYFVKDSFVSAFRYDLVIGVLAVAAGIFILIKPDFIASILPVVLGIFIIVSSMIKLQNALDLKRFHYDNWWVVVIFAVLTTVLGIIIIVNPFEAAKMAMMFVGVALAVDGVLSLISLLWVSRQIKKLKENTEIIEMED